MIAKRVCPMCQGTGIRMIQTSSMFGLLKKEVPSTCDHCNGQGYVLDMPTCKFCNGQGLVGNERDICRACNGTGKADSFAFIPRSQLKPGTIFERRCDKCGNATFELMSSVEEYKLTKSWEREEELRQVEMQERVKVRCTECAHTYTIPVDPELHQTLSSEEIVALEQIGVNLGFLNRPGAR